MIFIQMIFTQGLLYAEQCSWGTVEMQGHIQYTLFPQDINTLPTWGRRCLSASLLFHHNRSTSLRHLDPKDEPSPWWCTMFVDAHVMLHSIQYFEMHLANRGISNALAIIKPYDIGCSRYYRSLGFLQEIKWHNTIIWNRHDIK